jgi:hypothetical protein
MTQNTKYWLMVLSVAAVMFGGVSWLIPAAKEPGVWWFRIGGIVVLGAVWAFYLWMNKKADVAPDFLWKIAETFFEKNGLAFILDTEVVNGSCHLRAWFQNRYERACEAVVMVRTAERWLAPQRHLPDARISFTCEPGAFGKATIEWPIPEQLQGRKVMLDVMASRKYRKGKGRLLRKRTGLMVGSAPLSGISDVLSVLGVLGGFHGRRAARTEIVLPTAVALGPIVSAQTRLETLWKLGDAVPVLKNMVNVSRDRILQPG